MVIYAQYEHCDPIKFHKIPRDQLLPLYVMDNLAHIRGLAGLFTACLFSGALRFKLQYNSKKLINSFKMLIFCKY